LAPFLPLSHPETRVSLERWHAVLRTAEWKSGLEVQKAAPKAKVLNGERVRFEVAGGNYRLIIAFDFRRPTFAGRSHS
jgi:mRNA interferase HigB